VESIGYLIETAEENAVHLLRSAGLDGENYPDPGVVAARLDIRVRRVTSVHLPGNHGAFYDATDQSMAEIHVRKSLGMQQLMSCIAHELGHLSAIRSHLNLHSEEKYADIEGAAVLMPRASISNWWSRHLDIEGLFREWSHVPPSSIALRLGEVQAAETWIATRRTIIHRRSNRAFRSGILALSERAIDRGYARGNGYIAFRLPDAPGRAVIVGPQMGFNW
jgi:hypothetical protein